MTTTPMPDIFTQCLSLLRRMYNEERAVFAYSTRIAGSDYVHDFSHSFHIRYTINTLLGLQRLSEIYVIDWDVRGGVHAFLDRQLDRVTNRGDQGLLLYLLARMRHPHLDELYARFITNEATIPGKAEPVQNLCWRLLGLSGCGCAGIEGAREQADKLFRYLHRHYFCRDSLFVRHNRQPLRGDFVSFGAMVYWLQSLWHYSEMTGAEYPRILFEEGVAHLLEKQQTDGGWPWFYHAPSGRVMDVYEIYSVHQDAMAHLFLFPAERAGVSGASEAIAKSTGWLHGQNDLGLPTIVPEPFLIYRSIRRLESHARAKRLARSVFRQWLPGEAKPIAPQKTEFNRECRSYHLGWLLYAWADRNDVDAHLLPARAG